ncbi:MAG TPA: hypothetical protein VF121_13100 [Thermoanaerobaculia bacterium]|nr:hypothetical protein [Thermoanaerobaculia bacterium]
MVHRGEDGYDGQFYLTLALDPLLREPGTLAALDNPRYRCRRILSPALSWLLALGRPRAVPWALVAVNLAAAGGLAAALAALAAGAGRSAWQGLLALAVPGVWMALVLSTADLLGLALLAAAVLAAVRRRRHLAAASLAWAALAREVHLLSLAAFFAAALARRDRRGAGAYALAALPAMLWNVWVLRTVEGGTAGVGRTLGAPFAALAARLAAWPRDLAGAGAAEAASFALFVAAAALAVWAISRAGPALRTPLAAAVLPYLALLPFAGPSLLDYAVSYLRPFAALWLPAVAVVDGGVYRGARAAVLGASAAASAAYLARQLGWV